MSYIGYMDNQLQIATMTNENQDYYGEGLTDEQVAEINAIQLDEESEEDE